MVSKEKINCIKELYLRLLTIIETYGKGEIDGQINQVKFIISCLEDNDFEKLNPEKQREALGKMHEALFPPRGGLSEFFIWSNDFDERL